MQWVNLKALACICCAVAWGPALAQQPWPQSPALRALEAQKSESKPTILSCNGWAWTYPSGFGQKAVTIRAEFVITVDRDGQRLSFSPDAAFNAEMPLRESDQWYTGSYATNFAIAGKTVTAIFIQVNRVTSRADVRYVLANGSQYAWTQGTCFPGVVQY